MPKSEHNIEVGDIISAYHAGFHRVTEVQKRGADPETHNDLVVYTKLLDGNMKPCRKTKNCCDAAYCIKIDPEWINEGRKEEMEKWANLSDLIRK